jgi:hypothetical protein
MTAGCRFGEISQRYLTLLLDLVRGACGKGCVSGDQLAAPSGSYQSQFLVDYVIGTTTTLEMR